MKPYNDNSYAYNRIINTVCMYQNEPVVVIGEDDSSGGMASILYPLSGNRDVVDIKEIDINPPTLGYYNPERHLESCYYISRSPKRNEWRQGLRSSALIENKNLRNVMFNHSGIAKIIVGDYPNIGRAKEICLEKGVNVAFHRNFAIKLGFTSDFIIEYKGVEDVAIISEGRISMLKGKEWCSEVLEMAIGNQEEMSYEKSISATAAV